MAIRFIVHTVTSRRDKYGNCRIYALVTSVKSARTLVVSTLRHSIAFLIRELLDGYTWRLYEFSTTLGMREWKERFEAHKTIEGVVRDDSLTAEMLETLEDKEKA
jgi:hypothetical protein